MTDPETTTHEVRDVDGWWVVGATRGNLFRAMELPPDSNEQLREAATLICKAQVEREATA